MTCTKTLQTFISLLIAAVLSFSCFVAFPKAAFAGESDSAINSWRYEAGQLKPEYSAATRLFAQSLDLSVQAGNYVSSDSTMTHLGIDVSEHQKTINWSAVAKTKVKYAILRSSVSYEADKRRMDKTFKANAAGCMKSNIPFGVYHYSMALTAEAAKAEGQIVVDALKEAGVTPATMRFPVYLDMEDNEQAKLDAATTNAIYNEFKAVLNANGYSKVGVYANCVWWTGPLKELKVDAEYRWVARYGKNDGLASGSYYTGFESMRTDGAGIWQFCSVGSVDGIEGAVDMNFASNTIRFLEQSGPERNLYRLYNRWTGEHFFTADASECGTLEGIGWTFEGVGWTSPTTSGLPVYRLYNKYNGDHHYTINKGEYDYLCSVGWTGEGIGWYSAWVDQTPLHRLYNPYTNKPGAHHYTTDESERDYLASIGWRYEGRGWYGITN